MNACTTYALGYIQKYPKTVYELRQLLRKKGFSPEDTDEAVAYLEKNKYVDDRLYCVLYLTSEVGRKGKPLLLIEGKLRQRGVEKEVIAQVRDELEEELTEGMTRKIEKLLDSYGRTPQGVQKITAKGYPYELVKKLLEPTEE